MEICGNSTVKDVQPEEADAVVDGTPSQYYLVFCQSARLFSKYCPHFSCLKLIRASTKGQSQATVESLGQYVNGEGGGGIWKEPCTLTEHYTGLFYQPFEHFIEQFQMTSQNILDIDQTTLQAVNSTPLALSLWNVEVPFLRVARNHNGHFRQLQLDFWKSS